MKPSLTLACLAAAICGDGTPDPVAPPDFNRRDSPWQRKRGTKCRSNARRQPNHDKQRREKQARKANRRNAK